MGSGSFDPAAYIAYAKTTAGKTTAGIYASRSLDPSLDPGGFGVNWPNPATVPIKGKGKSRRYLTPDGEFPGPTTILKVLGLSTEALIAWSANEEREAVLAAMVDVMARGHQPLGSLQLAIRNELGKVRAHQRIFAKAAEIGTEAHQAIRATLLGEPVNPLSVPAAIAWNAARDWWSTSGLKVIRTEQPVWDANLGYAGTIDYVAEHPEDGLGVLDLKTSAGIYPEHHLQVASYLRAGRNFADLRWGLILKVPKTKDGEFEVRDLGEQAGPGSTDLTEEQLMTAFLAAFEAWKILV